MTGPKVVQIGGKKQTKREQAIDLLRQTLADIEANPNFQVPHMVIVFMGYEAEREDISCMATPYLYGTDMTHLEKIGLMHEAARIAHQRDHDIEEAGIPPPKAG